MFEAADYKLTDLLGVAGSIVALIFAGNIFLSYLAVKYTALADRYRGLADEYRRNQESDPRRDSLRNQIINHQRQLTLLNLATSLTLLGVCCFVVTVTGGALSVVYPRAPGIRLVATVCLIGGLLGVGVAAALGLVENLISRHTFGRELEDLVDLPKKNTVPLH